MFNSGAVLPSLLALVHTNVLRSRFPGDPYLLASETAWCGREGEEGRKGERRGREEEGRREFFVAKWIANPGSDYAESFWGLVL